MLMDAIQKNLEKMLQCANEARYEVLYFHVKCAFEIVLYKN